MWSRKITPPIMWQPMLRYNSSPSHFLSAVWKRILHFFFPRVCVSCGKDLPFDTHDFLCASCKAQLVRPGPLICVRCGVELPSGGAHCFACRGSKGATYKCKLIRSAFVFNTPSRALVHALKYQGADYVAPFMGRLMSERYKELTELGQEDLVIPVPLFPKRQRKRGYNQSELLAHAFATEALLALDTTSLVRTRDTLSQTKLGRKGRLENMTGAFACKNPQAVKGKTILLIDDVATTGATLEGCAMALRAAGAKRVVAYTFAREN